jgi:hypothetical protein
MSNKLPKGAYVSRSTYQKVVEENKRLLADIKVLAMDWDKHTTVEQRNLYYTTVSRWQQHFQKNEQFNQDLREILSHVSPQSPKTS